MSNSRLELIARILAVATACTAHAQGVGPRKIAQLIGDYDFTLRTATLTQTRLLANIGGTDLGSSFEHKGRLYLLFGDTFTDNFSNYHGRDTLVYTNATDPWSVTFTFPFKNGSQYHPITVPGAQHGGFCVPSGGVSYGGNIYMVYTNNWYDTLENMERSFMCKSENDGQSWTNEYVLSQVGAGHDMTNTHFINVSMSIVGAANSGGLPYPGQDNLLIYGSGAYRKSQLYLAAMPANQIGIRSTLRYFSGVSGGAPQWSTSETQAATLQSMSQGTLANNIGEFSVQYIPQLAKWVALWGYVKIGLADQPWGPFSDPEQLWHAWGNDGYGNFIHVPTTNQPPYDCFGDGPHDVPGLPGDRPGDRLGGPYGPYLIPRFTTGNATNCQLYFTLSTWNPYRTVLMRAQWPIPRDPPTDPEPIVLGMFDPSWQYTSTQSWRLALTRINTFTGVRERWMSTHDGVGSADDEVGVMWRWLPRDDKNKTLSFYFHGGDEEIMLLEGAQNGPPTTGNLATIYDDIKAGMYGRVVECSWGPNSNAVDHKAEWDLRAFDRANLKVVIIDHEAIYEGRAEWNFVSVGPMSLTRFR